MRISKAAKSGFIRAFDMGVRYRKWPSDILISPKVRDYKAIREDWSKIGRDIRKSEDRFRATFSTTGIR